MPKFDVIDARDAPLAPGMRLIQLPDGTYRVLAPGLSRIEESWPRITTKSIHLPRSGYEN